MNNPGENKSVWVRFVVPSIFGAIAAACYWKSVSSHLEPVYFVQLQRDVTFGEPIHLSDLAKLPLRGDTNALAMGALLWEQHGEATQAPAARRLRKGQVLLKSDLQLEEEVDTLLEGEWSKKLTDLDRIALSDEIRVGVHIMATIKSQSGRADGAFVGPFRVLKIDRDKENQIVSMQIATRPLKTARGTRPDPEYMRLQAALLNGNSRDGEKVIDISVVR